MQLNPSGNQRTDQEPDLRPEGSAEVRNQGTAVSAADLRFVCIHGLSDDRARCSPVATRFSGLCDDLVDLAGVPLFLEA
jgi:hypothetical protein